MHKEPLAVLLLIEGGGDVFAAAEQGQFTLESVDRLAAGLQALTRRRFDVVLLDLSLSDGNGLETLARIRQVADSTPVIVLVEPDDTGAGMQAIGQGAEDYFIKGRDTAAALVRSIHHAVERSRYRQVETHYQHIFQSSPVGIAITRLSDGRVVDANPYLLEMLGYTRDEMLFKNGTELDLWGDPQQRVELSERIREKGSFQHVEVVFHNATGQKRYGLLSAERIELNGDPCILSMVHDVTQRKQDQLQIERTEKLLRLLKDIAVMANEADDIDAALQYTIEQVCERIGWEVGHVFLEDEAAPGALVSTRVWTTPEGEHFANFRTLTNYDFKPLPESMVCRVFKTGQPEWISLDTVDDSRFLRVDAARQCGLRAGYAFPLLVGERIIGVIEFYSGEIIQQDAQIMEVMNQIGTQIGRVIEREKAAGAILKREAYFEALVENASDMISVIDGNGIIQYDSLAVEHILGYPAGSRIGTNVFDYMHKDDMPQAEEALRNVAELNQRQTTARVRYRHYDGSWRVVEGTVTNLLATTEVSGFVVNYRDITERSETEDEIQFQATLLDAVGQAVIATDREGKIIYWNRAAEQLYGWQASEVQGRNIVDVTQVVNNHKAAVDIMKKLAGGETWSGEFVLRRRDGTTFPSQIINSPIYNTAGNMIGIIGVSNDISALKTVEQELRESERFARAIVDAISANIAILDDNGTIIEVNQSWRDFAGENSSTCENAYLGTNYLAICDAARGVNSIEANQVAAGIRAVMRNEKAIFTLEYPCHSPTERRWFMVKVTRFRGDGPRRLVVTHENITQRKQAEVELRQFVERFKILHDIDKAILSAQSPESVAQSVLERLKRIMAFDGGNITMYDLEQYTATPIAAIDWGDPFFRQLSEPVQLSRETLTERLLLEEIFVEDDIRKIDAPTPIERRLIEEGTRSIVNVPLITADRYLGTLYLKAAKPAAFSPEAVEILAEVGNQLAVAIESGRLVEAERKRNAELSALHEISLQLTSSLDLDTILNIVVDYGQLLIEADNAHIFLYDGQMLSFGAAFWDGKHQRQPIQWPRPEGITYEVAQTGKRKTIRLVDDDPDYTGAKWGGGIISLPMRIGDQIPGVLNFAFTNPHHFTSNEIQILELLADQAAIAIHNAQLYGQIQEHAGMLEERVAERTSALQQEKERVEAIFKNSSDAILLISETGNIEQVNPAFQTLFGYEMDEITGQSLAKLVPPDQIGVIAEALNRLVQDQESQRVELTLSRRIGETFDADVVLSPIISSGEEPLEIVCGVRDMTVRKKIEDELRHAFLREKELSELRARFVSMVSHEYRTPLAVINSKSELLMRYFERLSEEQRQEGLEAIQNQVRHMTVLLDDILMFSKEDAAGLALNMQPVDLIEFCEEIIDDVRQSSNSHPIELVANEPCYPVGLDSTLMRQVMNNVLSNAVKYSPEGGTIHVSVACEEDSAIIRVRDEGIGIPASDIDHLFEAFYRGNNVGNIPGTGLGLVILKRAVEAHGGSISVESRVGKGTTFIIWLPRV